MVQENEIEDWVKIEEVKRDMDIVTFVEEYLGIKLLVCQKEILRKMWSTGKIYIYPWQSYERPKIYEMAKCFSLIGDITEVKKHVTNGTD